MAAPKQPIVHDAWDVYVQDTSNGPVFISFDVEAARQDLTGTLPHCARVLIPVREPNENGGPVEPESTRLYDLEDELCGFLEKEAVVCRLVARLTHGGTRELVFQVDDWEQFRPPVDFWMSRVADYDIDVSEHEGWEFFDSCIRPTEEIWLDLANNKVVDGLIESGSDPDKDHELEFVFIGEPAGLQLTFSKLLARGYTPAGALDFAAGEIVMVKLMPLDRQAIFDEALAHRQLAEECGVEYSGWGAAVVK
ncbi:MAG: DUF695 domain-containing protein [Gemmataceae bacterium]